MVHKPCITQYSFWLDKVIWIKISVGLFSWQVTQKHLHITSVSFQNVRANARFFFLKWKKFSRRLRRQGHARVCCLVVVTFDSSARKWTTDYANNNHSLCLEDKYRLIFLKSSSWKCTVCFRHFSQIIKRFLVDIFKNYKIVFTFILKTFLIWLDICSNRHLWNKETKRPCLIPKSQPFLQTFMKRLCSHLSYSLLTYFSHHDKSHKIEGRVSNGQQKNHFILISDQISVLFYAV